MSKSNFVSIITQLIKAFPNWHTQMYFKSSLIALSHAMEDQVLASAEKPLVIATFQRERFYKQETHRYQRIGEKSDHVYVLVAPETDFTNNSNLYEKIAFPPQDTLSQEWHLVILGEKYSSCLICREKVSSHKTNSSFITMDNSRRFEGIWTFDRDVTKKAGELLLHRILNYRPELETKVNQALDKYCTDITKPKRRNSKNIPVDSSSFNSDLFVERLVTYLQAGQYKIIKANYFLSTKEKKERLLNSVIGAIRKSLNHEEILQVAVNQLGEGLEVSRCIIYRCQEKDVTAIIEHEFHQKGILSIKGKTWDLKNNHFFQEVIKSRESVIINDVVSDSRIQENSHKIKEIIENCSIVSWLLVPILYQNKLLGMMELHHCTPEAIVWNSEEITLLDTLATNLGVALIQAESFANLEDFNQQLEALDRTRSNLVAITGHELRTPLSTIQVCLESLAAEPDMPQELRQVMLDTALQDAERLRKLVQDFLSLSQLESGTVEWNSEPLSLSECIELSLSHIRSRQWEKSPPTLKISLGDDLPLVEADGEWLVEVLTKLLDNACKFANGDIIITINVTKNNSHSLEVIISDNGRGIEPESLDHVFDRFYQEEGALRRSTGGTGLGLAICRQIVNNWGGDIWAESSGKNKGSKFHFTVPIFQPNSSKKSK